MTISQFFILSPRGDSIISKDFRGDAGPNLHDTFFRKIKFWDKGDAPPVLFLDGITFIYIKRNSLIIACTTRFNVSPSNTIELLNRIAKVFKDYCGILSEEAIRKNFILLYELLDEMMDYGYPQITSTELLKGCIHNEPVVSTTAKSSQSMRMLPSVIPRTMPSNASSKPIALNNNSGKFIKQKNEIFVDILEKITVLLNADGFIVNSAIDGSIQMKSYLSGNPELRLALNEDLVIGKGSPGGSVVLDDCNFHECVRLDEFETSRILHFFPPEGEFSVLNYRVTGDFRIPFRINHNIDESGPYKIDVNITIRADIPETNHATNFILKIPVPKASVSTTFELYTVGSGNTAEYNASEKQVIWSIRKFVGNTEHSIRLRITVDQPVTQTHKREIGPISLIFEIPMYNVSNLQVRYLRISETHKSYNPYRWVRYVTQSSSYVSRLRG